MYIKKTESQKQNFMPVSLGLLYYTPCVMSHLRNDRISECLVYVSDPKTRIQVPRISSGNRGNWWERGLREVR